VLNVADSGAGRGIAHYCGMAVREVGDYAAGEIAVEGTAAVREQLTDAQGRLRAGALLTLADSVAGFCAGLAVVPDGWVVSTNLMLRAATLRPSGVLHFTSGVARRGRASVLTTVDVHDDDGSRVASGMLTSAVLVPDGGPPQWPRPARLDALAPPDDERNMYDWLGIDGRDGEARLAVTDAVRNPWGIVHGGVTAAVIDHAATGLVRGSATYDAVVHYLAPNRVGPVHATSRRLGDRADGTVVRVEVRDAGADGRRTALAVVTVRADR